MNNIYVLDLQFFRNNDKSIIVKSISVSKLFNSDIIDHFIFKPPFDFLELNLTRRAEARHVSAFYHHINWNEGFIDYSEMNIIIQSLLADATEVFVKGNEKAKFINSILSRDVSYNVEQLNCPNLKVLKAAHSIFESCPVSSMNVTVLKLWLKNLFLTSLERANDAIKLFNKIGFMHMRSDEIYFLPANFLIDKVDSDGVKSCLKSLPPHIIQDIDVKKHIKNDNQDLDDVSKEWSV